MAKKPPGPTAIQDLAETVGPAIVAKLMAHFGGRDIKIPKAPPDDHPLVIALGAADARALCEVAAGELYVPHGRRPRSVRAEVRALTARGLSRTEIAKWTGVSVRHVRRVRQGREQVPASGPDDVPARPTQGDLFGAD